MKSSKNIAVVSVQMIERRILFVRGEKVLLDSDLAELYGVTTGHLNEVVSRNIARFPNDFMFQLNKADASSLRSQIVTSGTLNLKSQFAISRFHGGRRNLPYAFTEQGVAMLSSVLNSKRAIAVNIEIMRTFVKLRELLATHVDLAEKLKQLEAKYDKNFSVVFDAIRALMIPPEPKHRKIGFNVKC